MPCIRSFAAYIFGCLLPICLAMAGIGAAPAPGRFLEDPYYPQQIQGALRLHYYYDRSGRWVKFSDWIPFLQGKFVLRHLEDFYELYGLPLSYDTSALKENIYLLLQALAHKFRHPSRALCAIENSDSYHKYRLMMFMQIHVLLMRMFLRLGSFYEPGKLHFYQMDFADSLENSLQTAHRYYEQALPLWKRAQNYAQLSGAYPFTLDLSTIESTAFQIQKGKLDYGRIIERHLERVRKKLARTKAFLDKEGRPRPVKKLMQSDIEALYKQDMQAWPLEPPSLR